MKLLNELRESSGWDYTEILIRGATPLELKVFSYVYRTSYNYWMKKLPLDQELVGEPTEAMFELLNKLRNRHIVGNEAKYAVLNFDDSSGHLIRLIITRKLDCNIAAKRINKALGVEFIPLFQIQLAKEVDINTLTYPQILQPKFDGVRVIAIKTGSQVTFHTRKGNTFLFPALAEELGKLSGDHIFDGELVSLSGKQENRERISGIVSSALHGGFITPNNKTYQIFDLLTPREFSLRTCRRTYRDRHNKLYKLTCDNDSLLYTQVSIETYNNVNHINQRYNSLLLDGYEGIILKNPDHFYSFKRSKDWVKLKSIHTVDLECIDTLEGSGKFELQIGSLVCHGKIKGKFISVNVGSGLTEADRLKSPKEFIGKTIEIAYNCITKDNSLFLPRFVSVRFDK